VVAEPAGRSGRRRTAILLIGVLGSAAFVLIATAVDHRSTPVASPPPSISALPAERPEAEAPVRPTPLAVPADLVDAGLGLRDGPQPVPLELHVPSIGVDAPVVGVGMTSENVMDAPLGPPGDPVWQQAFWYRGSAVPGVASTALLAGHVGGAGGTPGVFGELDQLRVGDAIVVRDVRTGLEMPFAVTESVSYTLEQAAEPAVLNRIYGSGPVAAKWAQPSSDGLAHLSLITCSGTFRDGTHDQRLVVYATRTG
jgi:sortase (surface protein transpeptidase)